MHGEHGFVGVGHAVEQLTNHLSVLVRNGVTDGVRDIDGARARIDSGLDNAAEEVDF